MVLKFVEEDSIRREVQTLFAPTASQGWILVGYQGPVTIHLVKASPASSVAELLPLLKDDEIQYALIRLPGLPIKDVLVTWIGSKVGKIERGKKSEHIGDIMLVLQPSHVQLTAFSKKGFTEEKLRELSDPSAGTHVIKADEEEEAKTIQADQTERAATSHKLQAISEKKNEERQKVVATVSGRSEKLSAVSLADADRIKTEVEYLLAKSTVQGWIVLHYIANTTLAFQASGRGGVDEVLPHLEDGKIQYILIRLPATSQSLSKDVFIQWIGPKVSKIEQGKKSEHLADMKSVLGPSHTELTAFTKQGFNDDKVRALTEPSAGTHIIKAD